MPSINHEGSPKLVARSTLKKLLMSCVSHEPFFKVIKKSFNTEIEYQRKLVDNLESFSREHKFEI